MTDQPTCETCKYFGPFGDMWTGECWRYPPVPVQNHEQQLGYVPITVSEAWCGEHKPKEKK